MARILLAEKQLEYGEILKEAFASYGHRLKQVTSGCEALEEYHKHDLLITALFLKDMLGFNLIQEIRNQDKHFKILVHSGSTIEWLEASVSLGANAALQKPVTIEELMDKIDSMLRGSTYMYH